MLTSSAGALPLPLSWIGACAPEEVLAVWAWSLIFAIAITIAIRIRAETVKRAVKLYELDPEDSNDDLGS